MKCALFNLLLLITLILRLVPPPTPTRMLAATSERVSPHYSPHATALANACRATAAAAAPAAPSAVSAPAAVVEVPRRRWPRRRG